MNDLKANIFQIQKMAVSDGPGIRTTVFFKGCNLRCAWCHNPESQRTAPEMMVYTNRCVSCGRCKEICPQKGETCTFCGACVRYCASHAREIAGKLYEVDEVMEAVESDRIFYDTSGGGVTFSGGECMLQIDFLEEILKQCRKSGIHTAVDTAGNLPWNYFERLLPYTDLFLYDMKCYTEELHKKGTGVSNGLILENLKRLAEISDCRVTVRIPVIPGFNADRSELSSMAAYLKALGITAVELLPYHRLGEQKYRALGLEGETFTVPSEEAMEGFRALFT